MGSGTQSVLEDICLISCRPDRPAQADSREKAPTVGGVGPDGIFDTTITLQSSTHQYPNQLNQSAPVGTHLYLYSTAVFTVFSMLYYIPLIINKNRIGS